MAHKPRKPANIQFGRDEAPPPRVALALAAQQMAFLAALLVVPSLFVRQAQVPASTFFSLAAASLLLCAVTLVVQARQRGLVGSGFFYPVQASTLVLPALMLGVLGPGGPAGAFTMVVVMGLVHWAASFAVERLRSVFTVEVAGLCVLLLGLGLGKMGIAVAFNDAIAYAGFEPATGEELLVGLIAFATMVGCNVWGRRHVKWFATVIGLAAGFAAAVSLDLIAPEAWALIASAPWVFLPTLPVFGLAWDASLIGPYAVTGLILALISMGVQTVAQRFNDANWVRPDLKAIARGLRAEGTGLFFGAVVNGLPQVASGGAVGLSAASGCTSRLLSYWVAGLLAVLALLPKIMALFLALPLQVTGALFLFLSVFTLMSGLQLIASRMLDNRRIIALGAGLVVFVSYELLHAHVSMLPAAFAAVTFTGFALAVATTVTLSLIVRLGVRQRAHEAFSAQGTSLDDVMDFMERQGRLWGVPPDVGRRAQFAAWQAFEILAGQEHVQGEVDIHTAFDEYTYAVTLSYDGEVLTLSDKRPDAEQMLEDDLSEAALAGYLVRRSADAASVSRRGSKAVLRLTFSN
ncbi:xanthine/uracil permease [Achromobacter sp. GG226]|uniref:solute carrier family 23 protein n=1 Tax=Verticiella alkaliphila TaxID=2779529 RepID=UPI001C0C60AA|nr:solute carrier family 23 protein [Verticiella sp. GG226]MBU4610469.1 xanthine/uracil permease [Verticiella sp. GG226]